MAGGLYGVNVMVIETVKSHIVVLMFEGIMLKVIFGFSFNNLYLFLDHIVG